MPKTINIDRFKEIFNENTLLIDVREKAEFDKNHIEGALNVPLNEVIDYEGDRDREIYIICKKGIRSQEAAQILENKGYKTCNIIGGMDQYE